MCISCTLDRPDRVNMFVRRERNAMGKIFVLMGKTSSGKDTIYERLLNHPGLKQAVGGGLKTVVTYTTRPMRPGEMNGVQYFFSTEEELFEFRKQDKVIEERCYHTVHGPWYYFMVNDGQIDLEQHSYLMINTLAGFEKIRDYYDRIPDCCMESTKAGKESSGIVSEEIVEPIYIDADPKDRLLRYIHRESEQAKPNYNEVCRRFLADEADFSEEELVRLGITKRYYNRDLEQCCFEIVEEMKRCLRKEELSEKEGQLISSDSAKLQEQDDSLASSAHLERGQFHG